MLKCSLTDKHYLDIRNRYYAVNDLESEEGKELYQLILSYNQALLEHYPFLKSYYWTVESDHRQYRDDCSMLDGMPDGWRKAFGMQMIDEMKEALIKEDWLYKITINDIKEKYGKLRIYTSGIPTSVYEVIRKYEEGSTNYCIVCGKPSKYEVKGHMEPLCEGCSKTAMNL